MSLRYTPKYDENGDIDDPSFFVEGMGDFAGEFSALDRDNFPAAALLAAEVDGSLGRVFTTIYGGNTDTNFVPTMTLTGWQNSKSGSTTIGADNLGIATFTTLQDGHFDIHWSGTWSWDGAYSWVAVNAGLITENDTFDTLRLHITVDGVEIAIAGPFEDGASQWGAYMVGAIQLPAGTHVVKVECEVVRRQAQEDSLSGQCTNTCTFNERALTILATFR